MKKMITFCIVTIMLASLCIFPTSAVSEKSINFSVICTDNGISVSADTDFVAAGISGSFDLTPANSGSVTFSQAKTSIAPNVNAYNTVNDSFGIPTGNTVKFGLMGDIMNGGSEGKWFTAVLENASHTGTVSVCLRGITASNANGDSLTITPTPDFDIQLNWIDGDATGNAVVDIKDLVRTKKIAADSDTSMVKYFCNIDTNNNGVVDALELANVRKILLAL